MKVFLLFFVLVTYVGTVHAAVWEKIVDCEKGAAVVDVNLNERQELQLVVRGEELLTKLFNAGMINLHYGQKEYIFQGKHAEFRQLSPTTSGPVSLGGVFSPYDLKKIISFSDGIFEVEKRKDQLVIKNFTETSGSSCDGWTDGDGECHGGSTEHNTFYLIHEYVLNGCN